MAFLRSMTVLQVRDVTASIAFYKALGFNGWGWPDTETGELVFAIIQRGDVTIGLQLLRGEPRVNTHWAVYVYVDDVAALHAEFAAQDVDTSELRTDQHYGCDDFDVRDPDGHLIAFGQDREPEHGPGLSERRGRG